MDSDTFSINFADPFVLMRDLQGMAENYAGIKRLTNVKRDTLMAAASIYKSLYGNEDGSIPATFQVVYFIGWAPSENQPKVKFFIFLLILSVQEFCFMKIEKFFILTI